MAKKTVIEDKSKKLELGLDWLMSDRFGRYSKYVIQERALPDGRDGLKPVQRRILYAMWQDGNTYDRQHRKSAKAVGYIIGYYHPHGDTSVYDAIVRLSQDFKINIPLIEMQGNNGSIDDDPPAAMRYTEARLAKITQELLTDIDKECVNFTNNYDDTMVEPTVLPLRFPLLLVNGSTGIASGYATNIAPHNLGEVIDATIHRLYDENATVEDLMQFIKGPDFPTGGIVQGKDNIRDVFNTGRGKVVLRSKCEIVETKTLKQIIVTEIPYEVVKINLVRKIDEIRLDGKIEGIVDVRDESGRDGLRVVIDIKKEQDANLVLNYLYKNTDLQVNYSYNMIAIVDHRPVLMNLLKAIDTFIAFRKETILRRSQYLLDQKLKRQHILEGLVKAISYLDEIIDLIRRSEDKADAKKKLMEAYLFSGEQAEAIVNLRLYRLSNTDINALKQEYATLNNEIIDLRAIIDSKDVLIKVIADDLKEIKETYNIPRRTKIEDTVEEITVDKEAMIINEPCVISVSKAGYIKRMSLRSFNANPDQLPAFKENDSLIGYREVETLDYLLVFTSKGNYACIPVYTIEEARFKDLGKHLSSYVNIDSDENVVSALVVKNFMSYCFITTLTKKGLIKRSLLSELKIQRYNRLAKVMNIAADDSLVAAKLTLVDDDIVVISSSYYYNYYSAGIIRPSNLKAKGIKAIGLKGDEAVDFIVVDARHPQILLVDQEAKMKRMAVEDLEMTNRGIKGILLAPTTKKKIVPPYKAIACEPSDHIIIFDGQRKAIAISSLTRKDRSARLTSTNDINTPFFIIKGEDTGLPIAPIIDIPEGTTTETVEDISLLEEDDG